MSDPYAPRPGYQFAERTSYLREIERLKSKWPNVESDVASSLSDKPLTVQPGDAIPNLGKYSGRVFKRRILSTDLKDGQRGGFRLVYLVGEDRNSVEFVAIYCKKEREAISAKDVLALIEQAEKAARLCCIEIETEPDCAEIWLGAELIDYAPCTVKVLPGTYRITCKIPPNRSAEHEFTCDGTDPLALRIVIP